MLLNAQIDYTDLNGERVAFTALLYRLLVSFIFYQSVIVGSLSVYALYFMNFSFLMFFCSFCHLLSLSFNRFLSVLLTNFDVAGHQVFPIYYLEI